MSTVVLKTTMPSFKLPEDIKERLAYYLNVSKKSPAEGGFPNGLSIGSVKGFYRLMKRYTVLTPRIRVESDGSLGLLWFHNDRENGDHITNVDCLPDGSYMMDFGPDVIGERVSLEGLSPAMRRVIDHTWDSLDRIL